MNTDMNTIRLLGAAQLLVFVGGMLSGLLLTSQLDPVVYPISL
jgi:hypothetical protein